MINETTKNQIDNFTYWKMVFMMKTQSVFSKYYRGETGKYFYKSFMEKKERYEKKN